jgi:hypothetical protein
MRDLIIIEQQKMINDLKEELNSRRNGTNILEDKNGSKI